MPTVSATPRVLNAAEIRGRDSASGLTVRLTLGPHTGFTTLAQAVLECPAGRSGPIDPGQAEETLFVLEGSGMLELAGVGHRLGPEEGVCIRPGEEFVLENTGPGLLRLVAVRIPDPEPPAANEPSERTVVRRLADQAAQAATAERWFRIVADPSSGLRSATHFVGEIPTARAQDHFHTYDEVIYVLEGEGVFHAEGIEAPLSPGTCIQLPARTVHCLDNTGGRPMRVVAVFRPAGSPAAAFYPDGTPAYVDTGRAEDL
jgi:mannose-6-phosphate isomerase-like protein (cupin superfamily)